MEMDTPSLTFRENRVRSSHAVFTTIEGLPTNVCLSSNFLSLSSCVSSLFSQSIVLPLQQAVCFQSHVVGRGSECSAVLRRTKGYGSATVILYVELQ